MSEGLSFDAAMEQRFQEYLDDLGAVLGNDARRRGLGDYVNGLLLPGERKSLEPIAERLESANVPRRHQSIHHFVCEARWSDAAVRERVIDRGVPALDRRAAIEHWIVDDTTVLKSGRHSVGVARQYSGLVGTTANCQSLVSLSLANEAASLPVACELYLPEEWAHDPRRRLRAGVPAHLGFRTKIAMALDQVRAAVAAGRPRGIVLADAAYGGARTFRDALRELGLDYALGVECNTSVVPVTDAPRPVPEGNRPPKVQAGAVRVDVLAGEWKPRDWHAVAWREGSAGELTGRFAARRVRVAPSQHRDRLGPEEWLLVEHAETAQDRRYWLVSLPAQAPIEDLVRHAKGRYRVEPDYRELKREVGLDKFEGRGWRGFNHHVTLCLAAYGFLVYERSLFPPRRSAEADANRAPQPMLHRGAAPPHRPHDPASTGTLPILRPTQHSRSTARQ